VSLRVDELVSWWVYVFWSWGVSELASWWLDELV